MLSTQDQRFPSVRSALTNMKTLNILFKEKSHWSHRRSNQIVKFTFRCYFIWFLFSNIQLCNYVVLWNVVCCALHSRFLRSDFCYSYVSNMEFQMGINDINIDWTTEQYSFWSKRIDSLSCRITLVIKDSHDSFVCLWDFEKQTKISLPNRGVAWRKTSDPKINFHWKNNAIAKNVLSLVRFDSNEILGRKQLFWVSKFVEFYFILSLKLKLI